MKMDKIAQGACYALRTLKYPCRNCGKICARFYATVEDSKSANCIREIREIVINTCQSDPNFVTVNSSQYIFYKLLHW